LILSTPSASTIRLPYENNVKITRVEPCY